MDLTRTRKLAGIEFTRPGLSEGHVSDTIVQQMGGFGRIKAMLGAKVMELSGGTGIGIRWPNKERSRGNYVEIRLEPSDTYTMEFFNVSGSSKKSVKKYDDVYFDSLVEIFEKQTGWFLSLGGSKKPAGSGRPASPEVPPTGTKHEAAQTWDVLTRGYRDHRPIRAGTFTGSEDDFVRGYEKGQGHKLKKVGEGQYKVITKTNTIGAMVYLVPAKGLPKSESESKLDELRALLGEDRTTDAWTDKHVDEIHQIIDEVYGPRGHDFGAADALMKVLKKHGWGSIREVNHVSVEAVSPDGMVVQWAGRMPTQDDAASGQDQMSWWPKLVRER